MTMAPVTALERSRGMRDLLPPAMRAFRRVEDAFRAATARWGYEEIRTPTIETYGLFTATGALGPQMLSRVYSFLDWDGWSGERVVLRPDSTIPVARAAAEARLAMPARLFYVQNVFRFSEVGDREDWQCGIEFLGAPSPTGDAEVAAVACETLEALGLEPTVRLSHAGIVVALVEALAEANREQLLDATAEAGLAALRPLAAANPAAGAILDAALQGPGGLALIENLAAFARAGLPAAVPALEELATVAVALAASQRNVVIDADLHRGLQYYTGVIFDFVSGGESWGAGGRYQPGAGVAESACGLGLEAARLMDHIEPATSQPAVAAIVPATPADLGAALAVARALHRNGLAAALAPEQGASAVAVTVAADRIEARLPWGQREVASVDELAAVLDEYR